MTTDLYSIGQKIEDTERKLQAVYQQTSKPTISDEQNGQLQHEYNQLNQQLHQLLDLKQSLILTRANGHWW